MRTEKFDSIIIIILLVITFTLLLMHHYAFNKSFIIDTNTPFKHEAITDSGLGGKSTANISLKDDKFLLDCHIIASEYPWPFCEISFDLGATLEEPTDLSRFKHAKVFVKYIGGNSASIRFQIRSHNPVYSTIEDVDSWKYNGLEYWPSNNNYPVKIPLNALQVATWWLVEREIPIEHSSPELNQVMVLEIATGNNIVPGHYQIQIEKIEFTGKYFTDRQVYFTIIILWTILALIGLALNIKRFKFKLKRALSRADELKRLNKLLNVESSELKNLVERDPLTGALNRAGVEEIFSNEFKVISLIFIDIDFFKPLNDKYGHNVGDEILKAFVKLISENSRSTDFLARWGGEEFLMICPNTKLHEAYDLAESLRQLIEDFSWAYQIKLTASFGVAQKENETTTDLIERADKALYAAKARGRNTVVVSDNLEAL